MMSHKYILFLLSVLLMYIGVLYLKHPEVFFYKFDKALIQKYLCSQDIPHEPPCKRLFLSDGEIHIAAGYLYVTGNEPTSYNFQHPPLIKYLYGFSILLFDNPFIVQVALGIALLVITYVLSYKIFKRVEVSLAAGLFMVADPLFIHLSVNALLDLGQAVLLMSYILCMIYYKKRVLAQGIILGLLCGAKFFGGSLFFILVIPLYLYWRKQFDLKSYSLHILVAIVTFTMLYIPTFIDHGGLFDIVFFQLKTVNYWMHHSVTSTLGASLLLFLTGYIQSWWGVKELIWSDVWSILWPILFIIALYKSWDFLRKRAFGMEFFISIVPVMYLVYLGIQAPFTRYFILILPFLYMTLSWQIIQLFKEFRE